MRPVVVVLFILAAPILAGCMQAPAPVATEESAIPELAGVAGPMVDGARTRAWWDEWVNAHPMRLAGSPTNVQASERIAADLADAGFDTRIVYYAPGGSESPTTQGIRAVVGTKVGATQPDKVLAWVSHYDSAASTVYAAYDDGSGTAVTLEVARALAQYDNQKTLMAVFFDAEELGVVASQYFVQQAMADKEATFDLVIGLDMTGINCPGHAWPLYHHPSEEHAADMLPILERLYRDQLGWDVGKGEDAKNCIVLLETHDRNSDENVFKEAGVRVLRLSGGRNAADYPEYHTPGDTTQFVTDFMGGAENVEKGFAMAANATAWTLVAFDRVALG